jgi:hypothetical protein
MVLITGGSPDAGDRGLILIAALRNVASRREWELWMYSSPKAVLLSGKYKEIPWLLVRK